MCKCWRWCGDATTNEKGVSSFVEYKDRKCTDMGCCVVFICFLLAWFGLCGAGYHFGNPNTLTYGRDYTGEVCGSELNNKGEYELYYPRLNEDLAALSWNAATDMVTMDYHALLNLTSHLVGVCVERCPSLGQVVCTDIYMADHELEKGQEPPQAVKCKQDAAYALLHPELCSECWFVAMNTTNVMHRCLEITVESTRDHEECTYPTHDPDKPTQRMRASDSRCITKKTTVTTETVERAFPNPVADFLGKVLSTALSHIKDIRATIPVILGCGIGVTLVLGFIWILVLRWTAFYIVWGTIIASLVSLFVLDCFLLAAAYSLHYADAAAPVVLNSTVAAANATAAAAGDWYGWSAWQEKIVIPEAITEATGQATSAVPHKEFYIGCAITVFVVWLFILLVVLSLRKKIRIMIAVVEQSTSALMKLPSLIFFPWLMSLQLAMLFGWTIYFGTYIATIDFDDLNAAKGKAFSEHLNCNITAGSEPSAEAATVNAGRGLATMVEQGAEKACLLHAFVPTDSQYWKPLMGFHLFMAMWLEQFFSALSIACIAGAICKWYWTRPRESSAKKLGSWPVIASMARAYRFHLGSLAFGSAVVAAVKFARLVMAYAEAQAKEAAPDNRAVKVLRKVLVCCVWCFTKCIQYLTDDAYIIVALQGSSFCPSAFQAVRMILGNVAQLAVAVTITKWVAFLGKLLISMLTFFITYNVLANSEDVLGTEVSSLIAPLTATLIVSHLTSEAFLAVYQTTIDTILLCFIVDKEKHGSSEEAFYPSGLYDIMVSVKGGSVAPSGEEDRSQKGGAQVRAAGAAVGCGAEAQY